MPAHAAADVSFTLFFKLGVEHIFVGYDHLLFLAGLLLVCTRGQSLVAIVSCFTVGHSITLGLAAAGVVGLPAFIAEPLIALTIFFVGVENIWRRGQQPAGRWVLTLMFGFIHGFGFASVLRDLGVGPDARSLALPLFAFNLGVEAGQLAFATLVWPAILWGRRYRTFEKQGVVILSAIIAVFGLYWFMERLLLT